MRRAARAIVLNGDKLLVMRRNKFGHEYYTLIGGEVEIGEEPDQTVIREVKEETGLDVGNPKLVFIGQAGDMYGDQYVYLCEYTGGEPVLSPDSVEAAIMKDGKNLYTPMWLSQADFAASAFLSKELKAHMLEALETGFPAEPETFRSTAEISYTEQDK